LPGAVAAGLLLAFVGAVAAAIMLWLDARQGQRAGRHLAGEDEPVAAAPLSWIPAADDDSKGHPISIRAALALPAFRLDVAFQAPPRFVALLGPSGAGKSLTLKTIAGLLRPDSGRVSFGSRLLLDSETGVDVPPEHRKIGYVAQGGALFEHLDVEANIGFALKRLPPSHRRQRTEELIKSLGLERLRHARPETLSGGEGQRVALARALVSGSSALLLDEPFASLDTPVRQELRTLLREVHDRTGIPVLLVTHDREDVRDLVDHVIVIDRGRVVQEGSVEEVFARPKTRSVARLLGVANVLTVRAIEAGPAGRVRARTDWGELLVEAPQEANASAWSLMVPADAVQLEPNGLGCQIVSWRPSSNGWKARLRASAAGEPLEALVPNARVGVWRSLNENCRVTIDPSQCHLISADEPVRPERARPEDR
jgi:ABC-type sulfate/molybdate transport systems ATPase subunit